MCPRVGERWGRWRDGPFQSFCTDFSNNRSHIKQREYRSLEATLLWHCKLWVNDFDFVTEGILEVFLLLLLLAWMDAKGSAGALHVVELRLQGIWTGWQGRLLCYRNYVFWELKIWVLDSKNHKVVLISILDQGFLTPFWYPFLIFLDILASFSQCFLKEIGNLNTLVIKKSVLIGKSGKWNINAI